GPIGDTINGIAGPFIALLAAILTFLAFYIQYKANSEQRRQFLISFRTQREENRKQNEQFLGTQNAQELEKKQRDKIWRIERFENQIYEIIQLHKENVNEISIIRMHVKENFDGVILDPYTIKGREVFKFLVEEITILYFVAKKNYKF